jgi:CheY-like chemotaxis protein
MACGPIVRTMASANSCFIMTRARVLLVDDDDGVNAAICEVLRGLGVAVDAFDSAHRALEFARTGPLYDMCMLDLSLGQGMSGWQLLSALRDLEHLRDVPVLVMSGRPIKAIEARAKGAQAVLAKPFGLRDLVEVMSGLLSRDAFVEPQPNAMT